MRTSTTALVLVGLMFAVGTANAESVVPDTNPSVDTEVTSVPKEPLRGAQDQFLQYKDRVKERATELKDTAATRAGEIKTNVTERREAMKDAVAEHRALIKQKVLERKELQGMKPEERKEAVRAHMEERKESFEVKRAAFASTTMERREKVAAKVTEVVTARFEHATKLLSAMVLRLSGIADRIDARIDALTAEGVDTAAAEDALALARTEIDEAEASVTGLSDALAEALVSDTPRESLQATRTLAEEAKTAIRTAHEALKKAAAALPRPALAPAS